MVGEKDWSFTRELRQHIKQNQNFVPTETDSDTKLKIFGKKR